MVNKQNTNTAVHELLFEKLFMCGPLKSDRLNGEISYESAKEKGSGTTNKQDCFDSSEDQDEEAS